MPLIYCPPDPSLFSGRDGISMAAFRDNPIRQSRSRDEEEAELNATLVHFQADDLEPEPNQEGRRSPVAGAFSESGGPRSPLHDLTNVMANCRIRPSLTLAVDPQH